MEFDEGHIPSFSFCHFLVASAAASAARSASAACASARSRSSLAFCSCNAFCRRLRSRCFSPTSAAPPANQQHQIRKARERQKVDSSTLCPSWHRQRSAASARLSRVHLLTQQLLPLLLTPHPLFFSCALLHAFPLHNVELSSRSQHPWRRLQRQHSSLQLSRCPGIVPQPWATCLAPPLGGPRCNACQHWLWAARGASCLRLHGVFC